MWLRALLFVPTLKTCLANFHSIEGRRDEPQLLSDVNAAQKLCVCGHSPSDSSNQLMGYLTLPSTSPPALFCRAVSAVKPQQMLREPMTIRVGNCHLFGILLFRGHFSLIRSVGLQKLINKQFLQWGIIKHAETVGNVLFCIGGFSNRSH